MKKTRLLVTLLLAFVFQLSFAQEVVITGKVSDESGPLPGVTVLVKGTNNGTQTDFDGKYTLKKVKKGAVLVFSYVGMSTVEKKVGAAKEINVVMESSNTLGEVMIVGYGSTKKASFTGSATQVKGEDLEMKNTSDVSKALQGEAAGVQVINSSGQPGSTAKIRIRGIGSVNGNRSPLYVVDGLPYDGNINSINPSDIESTTILKDASATAIYGSRGANGVVVITTKKGKAGVSRIEVTTKYGQNSNLLPRYSTIKSPEEYVGISWDALYQQGIVLGKENPAQYASDNLFSNKGIQPNYNMWKVDGSELIDPVTKTVRSNVKRKYNPENWEDYAFQSPARVETNVKLSGGANKTTYYTSFGFLNDKGYSINTDFRRYTAKLNVNHEVKKWLKGSMDVNYANTNWNNGGQSSDSGSVFWFVDNIPSIYPLFKRDANGKKINDPYYGGYVYDYGDATQKGRGFGAFTNGVADTYYNLFVTNAHQMALNNYLEASLTDDVKLSSRFGLQYVNQGYTYRGNPFYGGSVSQGGSIYKLRTNVFAYAWTKMLRYEKEFDDHSFQAFIAHENSDVDISLLSASKSKLADPFGDELNNAVVTNPSTSYKQGYSLESYFTQLKYNYAEKYFASLALRRDGSSRFRKNKWGNFGSFGVAWMLSEEDKIQEYEWIKQLKLKASYGIIGEQGGVGYYPGYDLYSINNLDDEVSLSFETKGNPDLTWEKSQMFQVGTEFNFFDVVEGSFDYYVKNTKDLIFDRRVGPSLGYAIIKVNDGNLLNQGFEFDVTTHILNTNDWKLDFTINGEIIKNRLTKMPIEPSTGAPKVLDVAGAYGRSKGHSIYDFYLREYAGVDSQTGASQWNLYYDDKNNDGKAQKEEYIRSMTEYLHENKSANVKKTTTTKYSSATQKYIDKSIFPAVRGAFKLAASYRGLELSSLFTYSLGGYAYDGQYAGLMSNSQVGGNNWHTDIRNRWQKPGDKTDIPRLTSSTDANVTSLSSRFVTKSDYLSLNNIRLGYNFSEKISEKLGLEKLSLWLSGDNLFILTHRKGFNPSTSETGGSSTYRYAPLSSITAGIKVQF